MARKIVKPKAQPKVERKSAPKASGYTTGFCNIGNHERCPHTVRNGLRASQPFAVCKCSCHAGQVVDVSRFEKPVAAAAVVAAVGNIEKVPAAVIRAWARGRGMKVGERGRLHPTVLKAYKEATQ